MEDHPTAKLNVSEKDIKRANKIASKMVAAFDDAVRGLNKLGVDRFAAHNFGVHMMLKAAAHAAAYNAMVEGRAPRADYWDAVCKDALDKAEEQLSMRTINLIYKVAIESNGDGQWQIMEQQS